MRLLFSLLLAIAASTNSVAQTSDSEATLKYIHGAWETLTRSMTDCHSLVDIKVTANPVLYLPVEISAPAEVAALEQKCQVKVVALPKRIEKLGDLRPEEVPASGLLYLPYPYVVPGGRFNEMYGWDSYFILLG